MMHVCMYAEYMVCESEKEGMMMMIYIYTIYLRVLKAVVTFVAAEKLVRETNVAAHAAYDLMIHHSCIYLCLGLYV